MEEKTNISNNKVRPVNISTEMRSSFLDYAMSVIVSRALPDVRDGLKPVHRRILHAMNDLSMHSDKPHKKSARIVGEVIGKYHPHGDTSVYEAMVRMAQNFSYRYPLVDGHGNFGSIDGDGAAAMRYTEARMSKLAMEMMRDINKDTIDFVDNYDGEEKEPVVLPARFPNLLANGSTGIAVGMATNIPPHNLVELIDALFAIIENPTISVLELMENHISGPDFPTGGIILGRTGIKNAFETGNGSIVLRGKSEIFDLPNGKKQIIIKEIPYQVNKSTLVEKIAQLVREKLIEGITDIRDESNRNGIRIVIELKRDIQADVVLNQLYKQTSLQIRYGINMLSLVNGIPKVLNLKEALSLYLDHQVVVIVRRTKYELKKAEERAHILAGLKIALDNIDEVITIIRSSQDDLSAQTAMMDRFGLSEVQSKAILDMRFKRLTGLERNKIEVEYNSLMLCIEDYKDILANHDRVLEIIKSELNDIREKFNEPRRTEIDESGVELEDEDLIPVEEIVISLTTNGYIKRIPIDTYRTQNRGGRGIKGMSVHEDDVVDQIITMTTHNWLLLFTNYGRVYRLKGYKIPAASRTSKGIPVVNLLGLEKDEEIRAMLQVDRDNDENNYIFFVTKQGLVKRVELSEFESIRQNGKIAISLKETDELVGVKLTTGCDEIIIGGSNGKAVRFAEDCVRPMGRTAAGVKGFNVDGGSVVGIATNKDGNYILTATEKGYGKLSSLDDYRITNRGGKGVKTVTITDKNGSLVSLRAVKGNEDLMIITDQGVVIRISLDQVSVVGRSAQGVKLINLDDGCQVVSCEPISKIDEEEQE